MMVSSGKLIQCIQRDARVCFSTATGSVAVSAVEPLFVPSVMNTQTLLPERGIRSRAMFLGC
jgi:hypothetical protein